MSLQAGVPNGRVTSRDVRRCHAVREFLPRRDMVRANQAVILLGAGKHSPNFRGAKMQALRMGYQRGRLHEFASNICVDALSRG